MDQISRQAGPGEYVQYGKWTFKNITDQVRTVTDPEEIRKFQENCVRFERSFEEQKGLDQKYFSPDAMKISPAISGAAKEAYSQGQAAVDRFFDGTASADELGETLQDLSDRLLTACKEEGYPCPLFGGSMAAAGMEAFYGEFRRMILDTAVRRNNAEGRQYVTGELTAQRNWKYYNSDYYYQSGEAVAALTDKFSARIREEGWEDKVSVPDYQARGLNLYNNFNSALSNHFNVDDRFIIDTEQVPPRDFRWFYQSGGNDGGSGRVTSLTMIHPDGTETFVDYTTPGFDPTDPAKGAVWAAYKDENGRWQYDSADFKYDFSSSDLKNAAGLLKFAGKAGASREAASWFLRNLQVYPGGYFSRFPQYGARSMNLRA